MTAAAVIVLVLIVAVGLVIGYGWITDKGAPPAAHDQET